MKSSLTIGPLFSGGNCQPVRPAAVTPQQLPTTLQGVSGPAGTTLPGPSYGSQVRTHAINILAAATSDVINHHVPLACTALRTGVTAHPSGPRLPAQPGPVLSYLAPTRSSFGASRSSQGRLIAPAATSRNALRNPTRANTSGGEEGPGEGTESAAPKSGHTRAPRRTTPRSASGQAPTVGSDSDAEGKGQPAATGRTRLQRSTRAAAAVEYEPAGSRTGAAVEPAADLASLKVSELQAALKALGLPHTGRKAELVERLGAARRGDKAAGAGVEVAAAPASVSSPSPWPASRKTSPNSACALPLEPEGGAEPEAAAEAASTQRGSSRDPSRKARGRAGSDTAAPVPEARAEGKAATHVQGGSRSGSMGGGGAGVGGLLEEFFGALDHEITVVTHASSDPGLYDRLASELSPLPPPGPSPPRVLTSEGTPAQPRPRRGCDAGPGTVSSTSAAKRTVRLDPVRSHDLDLTRSSSDAESSEVVPEPEPPAERGDRRRSRGDAHEDLTALRLEGRGAEREGEGGTGDAYGGREEAPQRLRERRREGAAGSGSDEAQDLGPAPDLSSLPPWPLMYLGDLRRPSDLAPDNQDAQEDLLLANACGVTLTSLGSAVGRGTARRGLGCLALARTKDVYLFDAGDDTQRQLAAAYHVKPSKLFRIFLTSLAPESVLGLPGLMCSINSSRERGHELSDIPVHVYGPLGTADFLACMMRVSQTMLDITTVVHEISSGRVSESEAQPYLYAARSRIWRVVMPPDQLNPRGGVDASLLLFAPDQGRGQKKRGRNASGGVLSFDPRAGFLPWPPLEPGDPNRRNLPLSSLTWTLELDVTARVVISALPGPRGEPVMSYTVLEAERGGAMVVERAQAAGVNAGKAFAQLKAGETVMNRWGQPVPPELVISPNRPGRKVVVLGNTTDPSPLVAPSSATRSLLQGVDVLVAGAVYCKDEPLATGMGGCTADVMGETARRMGARYVVLSRFDSRARTQAAHREYTARLSGEVQEAAYGGEGRSRVFVLEDLDSALLEKNEGTAEKEPGLPQ